MKRSNILIALAGVFAAFSLWGCGPSDPANATVHGTVSSSSMDEGTATESKAPSPTPAITPSQSLDSPANNPGKQAIKKENGTFSYLLYEDHAEITYYFDYSAAELSIPEELEGVPVTAIREWAFANHNEIRTLDIPKSVTEIGSFAFYHCMKLDAVTIPDTVREIGGQAFDCTKWFDAMEYPEFVIVGDGVLIKYNGDGGAVTIPSDVKCISSPFMNMAYSANRITSVTIPYGVHTLSDYAFENCRSIQSIVIPDSVTKMGQGVFMYCTSLQQITYSAGMTYIPQTACYGCTSLTSFYVSAQITAIGKEAFGECTSLTGMTIPDSVTRIDQRVFYGVSDGFTLYGTSGSYAESYAKEQGIPFSSRQ